jgi:hypothetical protein
MGAWTCNVDKCYVFSWPMLRHGSAGLAVSKLPPLRPPPMACPANLLPPALPIDAAPDLHRSCPTTTAAPAGTHPRSSSAAAAHGQIAVLAQTRPSTVLALHLSEHHPVSRSAVDIASEDSHGDDSFVKGQDRQTILRTLTRHALGQ